MEGAGISGARPGKRRRTTIRLPGFTPATDLVSRKPGQGQLSRIRARQERARDRRSLPLRPDLSTDVATLGTGASSISRVASHGDAQINRHVNRAGASLARYSSPIRFKSLPRERLHHHRAPMPIKADCGMPSLVCSLTTSANATAAWSIASAGRLVNRGRSGGVQSGRWRKNNAGSGSRQ
jgi:hypothetical protein